MKYSVKRFSYGLIEGVSKGKEYIDSRINTGLTDINNLSTKLTEDPRFKDVKPVKRYGKFTKNLSYLLKGKKKSNKSVK